MLIYFIPYFHFIHCLNFAKEAFKINFFFAFDKTKILIVPCLPRGAKVCLAGKASVVIIQSLIMYFSTSKMCLRLASFAKNSMKIFFFQNGSGVN